MSNIVKDMPINEVVKGLRKFGYRSEAVDGGFIVRAKGFIMGGFKPVSELEMRRLLHTSLKTEAAIQGVASGKTGSVVIGGIMENDYDE